MSEILYKGFHTIKAVNVLVKDRLRKYEKIEIKDAVAGIVLDRNDRIALVKQYRPCVDKITYEIPAGLIDKPNKTNIEILLEELKEECGIDRKELIRANQENNIEFVCEYYTLIGSSSSTTSLYWVQLDIDGQDLIVDDEDVIAVEWFSLSDFCELINDTDIQDSKTLKAYLYLLNNFRLK